MSRYIDADAFLKEYCKPYPHVYMAMSKAMADAPSIDIVRCRECRYFIDNLTEDDTDEAYGECCFDWDIKMPTADDFCSYGERKESE